MEPLSMAGGGLKHVGKMFVPGLTPQFVWTFRGAEAPAQLTEKRPVFYVRELPTLAATAGRTERDLLIIRVDKKRDHRELQTTNGGNMFTLDRKSTRLNSSHLGISYAVFRLKK